jgi:hypothetical protein
MDGYIVYDVDPKNNIFAKDIITLINGGKSENHNRMIK